MAFTSTWDSYEAGEGQTASDSGPCQYIDGDLHGMVCSIKLDGTIACWSLDGASPMLSNPVCEVPLMQQSVGSVHACAIDTADKLYCRGENRGGQLQALVRVGPFTMVSVGDYCSGAHTCDVQFTGGVTCCGNNLNGQLEIPDSAMSVRAVDASDSPG